MDRNSHRTLDITMKRLIPMMAALGLAACDQDDTRPWPDTSTDTSVDTTADNPADLLPDLPEDTSTDASDGSGGDDGPVLLYDGAVGTASVIPGWRSDSPRPVIVLTRYSSESIWHVSMAEVDAAGTVGGMVTDLVRVWGWGDFSANAPTLLYEGPRDGSAVIPWSSADPTPLIVLSRYSGSDTWFVSMAEIDATGLVGGMVTDEIKVWGWSSDADPGAPAQLYDGVVGGTLPSWDAADPDPLIVMTTRDSSDVWWLSMAEVSETGAVSGMITDRMRVFGW
ncbi:MAG: hypothetical protein JRG91_19310 [Deltaproteobacteria bacterium]|nr:hypothetical protein [Deltaproteobacteria bacterium]